MEDNKTLQYIKEVLDNMPSDWLNLTTHRLDIYDEQRAKNQFLEQFEQLFESNNSNLGALSELPTAYDYIRLGHPLSCILEWALSKENQLPTNNVISFSSKTAPILAVLRKNKLAGKNTRLLHTSSLPSSFDIETVRRVYGYTIETALIKNAYEIDDFDGSTVLLSQQRDISDLKLEGHLDFYLHDCGDIGSILFVNGDDRDNYIAEIQHVRRRETIAMTPANCLIALNAWIEEQTIVQHYGSFEANKNSVLGCIKEITDTTTNPLVGSSGLSIQYAIMMGLVEDALDNHPGKEIKFVVPPNCYGGTNDQARRVAASIANVSVVDLPVDGDNDMVQSIDAVLDAIALDNAVPYIIAEIPTNPRVEVPELEQLKIVLGKERKTATGDKSTDPVFILDQTFCPNVHFLGAGKVLSDISAISYASGSKFPSGGLCTAGYCASNNLASAVMTKIEKHMLLCENEATALQYELLAQQLPSMNQRISDAYKNTREFVNFIQAILPEAKINFVSEELASAGFTPSVFSLDLPTKGKTDEEREAYKRALNLKLINMMITEIPDESKYCVSYGQLKGCYWTIPATSTQGTTQEGDKDYIARVALSANMDLERHKSVFTDFVHGI